LDLPGLGVAGGVGDGLLIVAGDVADAGVDGVPGVGQSANGARAEAAWRPR
jgi:hypothetical protein